MTKKISERIILRAIMDYFNLVYSKKNKCYCFRASSGNIITPTGKMFKTGRPGLPDIVCCIDGIFNGIEVKTMSGKQSGCQKKAQQDIEQAQGKYYIVRSLEQIKKIFPC